MPATASGSTTVNGTIAYANASTATAPATNVTYAATIGTAGSCPAAVRFPTLPTGVTASYNSTSCQVTLSGAPTSLTAGQSISIGFQYTGPNTGTIAVSSTIGTATAESNTASDTSLGSTVFAPVVVLAMTKTDSNGGTYVPGGTGLYTLKVINNGPNVAIGASIADNLPNGVMLSGAWTCTASAGSSYSASSGGAVGRKTVSLTGTLPSGGVLTIQVPVNYSANPAAY